MTRFVIALLSIALLSACQSNRTKSSSIKRKTPVKFNGLSRTYLLHSPSSATGQQLPLVVVLHGAFSTAKEIELHSGFSKLADTEQFYVAYPNGIGLFGKLQHWNAGHCCGKAADDNVDDVGFINAVIDDAIQHSPINSERIYLVGYSNGGMMAYRYAQEQTERLKGLTVIAGAIDSSTQGNPDNWKPSEPSSPLPVLIIHGGADPIIPPEGGESPEKKNGRMYASVQEAADYWTKHNNGSAPVKMILLENWEHMWPGPYFTTREDAPENMKNYDAAPVIWDFLKKH